MNADLKRVRDSSLDGAPSSSKRRALSTGASSPQSPVDSNGNSSLSAPAPPDDDGLEDWMRIVETKRKEAIYRQMLEYRRSTERESARANALERQCRAHENVLRSFEACWAQVSRVQGGQDLGTGDEGRHVVPRLVSVLDPLGVGLNWLGFSHCRSSLPRFEIERDVQTMWPTQDC